MLDAELELYNKEQEGGDTLALQRKISDLRATARQLGVHFRGRGGFRGAGGRGGFTGRGRGGRYLQIEQYILVLVFICIIYTFFIYFTKDKRFEPCVQLIVAQLV